MGDEYDSQTEKNQDIEEVGLFPFSLSSKHLTLVAATDSIPGVRRGDSRTNQRGTSPTAELLRTDV